MIRWYVSKSKRGPVSMPRNIWRAVRYEMDPKELVPRVLDVIDTVTWEDCMSYVDGYLRVLHVPR